MVKIAAGLGTGFVLLIGGVLALGGILWAVDPDGMQEIVDEQEAAEAAEASQEAQESKAAEAEASRSAEADASHEAEASESAEAEASRDAQASKSAEAEASREAEESKSAAEESEEPAETPTPTETSKPSEETEKEAADPSQPRDIERYDTEFTVSYYEVGGVGMQVFLEWAASENFTVDLMRTGIQQDTLDALDIATEEYPDAARVAVHATLPAEGGGDVPALNAAWDAETIETLDLDDPLTGETVIDQRDTGGGFHRDLK
ncbi:hypothetical protein [Nesterenkonia halophila]